MQKQTQAFENMTGADLLVDVECYPDRYVLKPGEKMELTYDHDGSGPGLHVTVYPGILQIFLDEFDTAVVTIDGVVREPWTGLTSEQEQA